MTRNPSLQGPAVLHLDAATRSCTIVADGHQYGQWGSGIGRAAAEDVIAEDGWAFAADSTWTLEPDGWYRPVVRDEDALVRADDALLTELGGRSLPVAGDELSVLLVRWRMDVDRRPAPPLIDTDRAIGAIGRARRRHRLARILHGLRAAVLPGGRPHFPSGAATTPDGPR
ncbi:hypothetical protein [Actinosynnema sp. NPDC023587]|uniref:hypothetical protein n=1 Tax=Actinosynnema sp. NPDC023587 TaxID=3154695 RepID=UPI00340F111C